MDHEQHFEQNTSHFQLRKPQEDEEAVVRAGWDLSDGQAIINTVFPAKKGDLHHTH